MQKSIPCITSLILKEIKRNSLGFERPKSRLPVLVRYIISNNIKITVRLSVLSKLFLICLTTSTYFTIFSEKYFLIGKVTTMTYTYLKCMLSFDCKLWLFRKYDKSHGALFSTSVNQLGVMQWPSSFAQFLFLLCESSTPDLTWVECLTQDLMF